MEGYTKGTVVLATVFGDVHDIGKSLVNTILTNNGYSVVDLGKQVPIGDDPRRRRGAQGLPPSASPRSLVSTSKQMPLAVSELHERGLDYPLLIGAHAAALLLHDLEQVGLAPAFMELARIHLHPAPTRIGLPGAPSARPSTPGLPA